MQRRWLSRVVTGVILVAVAFGGVMLLRSRMPTQSVGQDFRVYALFRDGSRLAAGSPVMIAGVRVGEVEALGIAGDFARVDLVLRDGLQIPVDSWLTKRAESAFGDSYLEIVPQGDRRRDAAQRRPDPAPEEGGSTDTVLRAIAHALPKIDHGLDTAHDVMLDGRHWIEAVLRERAEAADRWLADDPISPALARADDAMGRFEDGTTRAADAVARCGPAHRPRRSTPSNDAIANARKQMADFKEALASGLGSARSGMDRVDQPLDDARDLLAAINAGSGDDWKGTLGRLMNTSDLADTLEDGTDTLRGGAAGLNRFHSWLGFRFEWNYFSQVPRVYVTAELNARDDKFYYVELSRDPLGGYPDTSLDENPGVAPYTRTIDITDSVRFTAQFGKRFGPLQLRGGIKESTPGAGADLVFDDNRVRLSADVFGSWEAAPRLKLTGAYAVFRGLYVLGGIDDALSTPGYLPVRGDASPVPTEFKTVRYGRDYFVGAALHFDDQDLATLLRIYGALFLAAI